MVTEPDPVDFYNLTKTAVLNVTSGRFVLGVGMGNSRIPELIVAVDEDVDHADQVQIRVISTSDIILQATVTDIEHRREMGGAQKVLTLEGLSYFLGKKWAEDSIVDGNTDTAITNLLALMTRPASLSLSVVEVSATALESYPARGYLSTAIKDLLEMATFVVAEGFDGGPALIYSRLGNRPGGPGTLELDGGNMDGWLISSRAMPTPIVNRVLIEGEREDFGYYEAWEPSGGETEFVLTNTPTSNVTIYYRDNVGDPEKTILQGGSKQDGQDYYVDRDVKTVYFDAHTVVGSGRTYYFDYQGRHPVEAKVANQSSIDSYWESWEEARNAIVKNQDDMLLLATKWLATASKKELRVVAASFFRSTFLPNTTVRVIDRLSKLDRDFVLSEVVVDYPSHNATLVFAENRPSLEDYLGGLKETLNRVDETPRDEGITIESFQEFFRFEVNMTLVAKTYTSTDGIVWTEIAQNLQPPDGIQVVAI